MLSIVVVLKKIKPVLLLLAVLQICPVFEANSQNAFRYTNLKAETYSNGIKTIFMQRDSMQNTSIQFFLRPPNNQQQVIYRHILLDILLQNSTHMTPADQNQWKHNYNISFTTNTEGFLLTAPKKTAPKEIELIGSILKNTDFSNVNFQTSKEKLYTNVVNRLKDHYAKIEYLEYSILNHHDNANLGMVIEQLTFEGFQAFITKYFQPSNFIFSIISDTNETEIAKTLKTELETLAPISKPFEYKPQRKQADSTEFNFLLSDDNHLHVDYIWEHGINMESDKIVTTEFAGFFLTNYLSANLTTKLKTSVHYSWPEPGFWSFQDLRKKDLLKWAYDIEKNVDSTLNADNTFYLDQKKNFFYKFDQDNLLLHKYLGWQIALNKEKDFYFKQFEQLQNSSQTDFSAFMETMIKNRKVQHLAYGTGREIILTLLNYTALANVNFLNEEGRKVREFRKGFEASDVVRLYLDSIGGLNNITRQKKIIIFMKGKAIAGKDTFMIRAKAVKKYPNLFYSESFLDSLLIRKQIFDGKQAYIQTMHDTIWAQNDSLYHIMQQSFPFPEGHLKELATHAQLIGIIELGNRFYFELHFTDKAGNKLKQLYEFHNLLKNKTEIVKFKTKLKEISFYEEYKKTGNLFLPTEITRFVNMYRIDIDDIQYDVRTKVSKKLFEIPENPNGL